MASSDLENVLRVLDRLDESAVEFATELVGFDTQNPPGRTADAMDWLESVLADWGVQTERCVTDPAKPNLLARVPGRTDRVLGFNGHLDTVPYDEAEWQYSPTGEREEERLYGRGATDMKGAIASMLTAIRAFREADCRPPVTLEFAFVSDEEVGGEAGLPALLSESALEADVCVIGEPTCSRGRHSVSVADRGSIWLTLRASGEAAHGSRPLLGTNAIDRLYEGIQSLRETFGTRQLDIDASLEPVLAESIAYYEPVMGAKQARQLFEYPTINLGTIEGGEAINTVPVSATAEVDIRLMAGVQTPDVLAAIRECVDECPGVTIKDVTWSIGTAEVPDSPLVEAVVSSAETVSDERIYRRCATGGGDAKKLRNAGIPTVDFAFGTDTVHAVDEYTTVDILEANANVYARVPFEFARRFEHEDE